MPARTPPKGRPTSGRRDRRVAQNASRSRTTTRKFVWGVLALSLLAAALILGTGTGGNSTQAPATNIVLPLLLVSGLRKDLLLAPRS